jgi:enoyl-CoA hydratase/carnithine racemase
MAEYRTIIYEPGPVTRIIHNEPEKRNVMGPEFEAEFLDAMKRFEEDREACVAVNLAVGKHFSAGHDIAALSARQDWEVGEPPQMTEVDWRLRLDPRKWYYPVWDCQKPLIAGVQGACLAAATAFLMSHDIIVMAEDAYLGMEITRTSGAAGGVFMLWMGYRKAFEWLCTGSNIGALELYRLGAINKVVPKDRVDAEAMRYGEIIALMPPETVKLTKLSLKFGINRMGARDLIWNSQETNLLAHLAGEEREKEFYTIMKEKGMKAALDFRDKPFEKYGYSRYKATENK